MQKLFYRS